VSAITKVVEICKNRSTPEAILILGLFIIGMYYVLKLLLPAMVLLFLHVDSQYLTLEKYTEPIFSVGDILTMTDRIAFLLVAFIVIEATWKYYKKKKEGAIPA
jgi:hypothetical protein